MEFFQAWYDNRHQWDLQLYIGLSDLYLHSRSLLHQETKSSVLIFLQISQSIWMNCRMLPWPVGLLKLILNLFHAISIHRREPDFSGKNSDIGSHSDERTWLRWKKILTLVCNQMREPDFSERKFWQWFTFRCLNNFFSNMVWWQTPLEPSVWYLTLHSRSQGFEKLKTFAMVNYEREMISKKSYMANIDHLSICFFCCSQCWVWFFFSSHLALTSVWELCVDGEPIIHRAH